MNNSADNHERCATSHKQFWLDLAIGVVLLSLAAWMDLTKPFGKSWTIFYLLPVIYIGWKARGDRLELPFYVAVSVTTFLIPFIFHRRLLFSGTGIFNRTLGALVGTLIIFLIWERRRYATALENANKELEDRVTVRIADLQVANEKLTAEIAERQCVEQQLRESEARFQTFVDHATDSFFLHDENGNVCDVNQQACDSLGYSRAELVGMNPMQFDPMVTAQRLQEIAQRLDAGETLRFDSVHRRKDGSEFPVEIRVRPFLSQGKRFRVALVRDISERKLAEQELRESEQRFRQLSDSAFEGLLIHEQGIIRDANRAFAGLIGTPTVEELVCRHVLDVIPLTPECRLILQEQLRSPKEHVIELSIQRADGAIRILATQSRRISFQGSAGRVVALRDVTERKKAEEERRKLAEQMQQAQTLESLGVMAGGIAHDFNNLLTVINGNCHLLNTKLDQDDPRHSFAAAIHAAGTQAAKLMRQLLLFSRGFPQQPEELNLKQVIEQSAEMWHKVVGDKVQVALDCADELWPVMADRSQIEQVLLNLILNARDAMPEGGQILVTAHNLELPLASDGRLGSIPQTRDKLGRFVQISVEDSGVGMSDKVRARVFEPFFTTKKIGEGTGLGLPMCHGIVRQTGGWIEVRSELGRGSTFCIVLPATANVMQAPPERLEQPVAAGPP